ncbi:MAG: glycerol-3-phosphate 1-O-acyltransferase PlsY [Planctomycetota bacterium]
MFFHYFFCAISGYLLGSIPFGYLLVKLKKKVDIRTLGSGNIGATNVARILGLKWGLFCFVLDVIKGFLTTKFIPDIAISVLKKIDIYLPIWCGTCLKAVESNPTDYMVITGLFTILGHLFPVYIWFKGGKGVATALGVFMVIAPVSTGIAFVIWLIFFAVLRYISLASIMASISLGLTPFFIDNSCFPNIFFWESDNFIIYACVITALLVIIRHIPNIKRLIAGTEAKVKLWKKDTR